MVIFHMTPASPSAHILLEGPINYYELFHVLFAGVAFAAVIIAVVMVWIIDKEGNP